MTEHLPESEQYEQGQRDAIAAAVQRVEALPLVHRVMAAILAVIDAEKEDNDGVR